MSYFISMQIIIRFSDKETEERALGKLIPRFSGKSWSSGEVAVPSAALAFLAKRRPLTRQEQERLLRHLNMMRMVCDTDYILNPEHRACPKLAELEKRPEK